jgi:hypothetical protein
VAAGDYAILVGICKYADGRTFGELQGPPNDIELVREWLKSPDGGDIGDDDHIIRMVSPAAIDGADPDEVPPLSETFKKAFKKLVRDPQGRFISRPGRLYLYFSGHGFCEKKSLQPQGALYAANATREFPENIYGTYYALVAQEKALFSEIVLVMDCCRDAEVNRSADVPPINEAGTGAANGTKLLCIYAAPKGGKAQERTIGERGGKVFGLLTHALLKALKEATPDAGDQISSAALKKHLLETWPVIYGDTPAPLPEIVVPTGKELYLRSAAGGVRQEFRFTSFPGPETIFELFGGEPPRRIVACVLRAPPAASSMTGADGGEQALAFDGKSFFAHTALQLLQVRHEGGRAEAGSFCGGRRHACRPLT